jgi:hypothetical protein
MNGLIYLVGLIVVIMAILSLLGLRRRSDSGSVSASKREGSVGCFVRSAQFASSRKELVPIDPRQSACFVPLEPDNLNPMNGR